jgi:hypothetical protein
MEHALGWAKKTMLIDSSHLSIFSIPTLFSNFITRTPYRSYPHSRALNSIAAQLAAQLPRRSAMAGRPVGNGLGDAVGAVDAIAGAVGAVAGMALAIGGDAVAVGGKCASGSLGGLVGLVQGLLGAGQLLLERLLNGRRNLGSCGGRRRAILRSCRLQLRLLLFLLVEEFPDVAVQPQTSQLVLCHVAGTADEATARGRAAEACKGLGHVPLGGGVEEGELVAGLETLGADPDIATGGIEELVREGRSAHKRRQKIKRG